MGLPDGSIGARDENGEPVDWWLIAKVPKLEGAEKFTGYEYCYFDATLNALTDPVAGAFQRSPHLLNREVGAWNETIGRVFGVYGHNMADSQGYIVWNDEYPASSKKTDDGNLGHTKGILAFDLATETALYIMHSWPKTPDLGTGNAATPDYGQIAFCVSLSIDTAKQIATMLLKHQEPQVIYWHLPQNPTASAEGVQDAFTALVTTKIGHDDASSEVVDLITAGGMPFKLMAKNRKWNKDIWCELIEPGIGQSVNTETWIRGPIAPVLSADGSYRSFDVKLVNMGPLGIHIQYPETCDHSKQGVALAGDWVIISDENRMLSQKNRGGGAIAFQNRRIWEALSRADVVTAPPGGTHTAARATLKATHPKSSACADK